MKNKLLAIILSVALLVTALPFQALVGAEGETSTTSETTEQTQAYNYSNEETGIAFYHFSTWANTYGDPDGVGDTSNPSSTTAEDKLVEIEAVLRQGYVNTIMAYMEDGTFEEVVKLCRKYDCKFWFYTNYFDSSSQAIDDYIKSIANVVSKIKAADAWDLFLGFHWDEPFSKGSMTNDDFLLMTEKVYKAYQKRIFTVFNTSVLHENLKSSTSIEIPQTYALKYVTDAGWDNYAFDLTSTGTQQNNKISEIAGKVGGTFTTADGLYRYFQDAMMAKFDHPVNVWLFPCAYQETSWNGYSRADEDYCVAHLEYFKTLLNEQEYKGGLYLYTYKSSSDRGGLNKYLPITDENDKQLIYTTTEKWTALANNIKAIKTAYETENKIYTGVNYSYASGLNDTASYFMNIPDDGGVAKGGDVNLGLHDRIVKDSGSDISITKDGDETFINLKLKEANTAWAKFYFNSFDRTKSFTGLHESIDQTKLTHFAMRIKVTGRTAEEESYFRLNMDTTNANGGNRFEYDLSGAYLIDKATGEITTQPWAKTGKFKFTGNFDGWIVVPFDAWTESSLYDDTNKKFTSTMNMITFWLYGGDCDWVSKSLSVGDIFVLEDADRFKQVHGSAPEITVTARKDSIKATSESEGVIYSINGRDWNSTGEFTGLEYGLEYTVYAKYPNGSFIASQKVWTAPNGSQLGDSASYYYNVPDEDTKMIKYKHMGTAADTLGKNDDGEYAPDSYMFVDASDGEGLISFDFNDALLSEKEDAALQLYINGFRDETSSIVDISKNVSTDNLTHMAVRVKIEGGTAGQASSFGMLIAPLYFEKDLSNAYLIDNKTGKVIDPNWTGEGFTFTDEFDGWIVFPFEAYGEGKKIGEETLSAKQILLGLAETPTSSNTASTIQVWLHDGCTGHGVTSDNSSWANRVLRLGDVLVLENDELFTKVRTCDQLGKHEELKHKDAADATEITAGNKEYWLCERCGKAFDSQNATNEIKEIDYVIPATLSFYSASLTLEKNITVNFKVKADKLANYKNVSAKFTIDGTDPIIVSDYTTETKADGEYRVYSFKDISPQKIGDNITAVLVGDGTESQDVLEYSVAKYCYNKLEEHKDAIDQNALALKTTCVDLLNYGAAAQEYKNYKTETPVNANLGVAKTLTSADSDFDETYTLDKTVGNGTVSWKTAALRLDDSVTMKFKLATEEDITGMYVKVTYDNGSKSATIGAEEFVATNGGYYVYFDGLHAAQMREDVTATVYDADGNAVSGALTYSVENYAAWACKQSDEKLVNLVTAMMKYGISAENL